MSTIVNKIQAGQRISKAEAAWLWESASDEDLSQLALDVKSRFHSRNEATYLIMAIINYTNVCVAKCDYCSFYRLPHQSGTYLLSYEQVCAKVDKLLEFGGTLIGFNGGFHPKLKISDYADLFGKLRTKYAGNCEFYEMTVAEFMFACHRSKLSYDKGAEIMAASGTRWITGGGAEVLTDSFRRRHSPGKFTVSKYLEAQRAILKAGMGSTATMVVGFDETLEERLEHLQTLRDFQDDNDNALVSFLCWTYKPYNNEFGGDEIGTSEYVRWLAICRIFLDNIVNIRTSVLTKNADAFRSLAFGSNDFDLPTEDEVTQKAGAKISHNFQELLEIAAAQGYVVKKRNPLPIRINAHQISKAGLEFFHMEDQPACKPAGL